MLKKTFQYRLYPTAAQETTLRHILDECRWLYNYLLEQRKTAYEECGVSLCTYDQNLTLPLLKTERPTLARVYSQTLQDVAARIDLAFKAFFRRVKAGEKPGYPRFRGYDRYDSFCYPQSGFALQGQTVRFAKIGTVRVVLHRPIEGIVKTCYVRRTSTGKWFVSFSCVVSAQPITDAPAAPVGIDVGLATFATLSTGDQIANPRFFRKEEKALTTVQRRFARFAKGTPKRRKQRKVIARVHERVANRRKNFAHQASRKVVRRFTMIAVEDLSVNQMVVWPRV